MQYVRGNVTSEWKMRSWKLLFFVEYNNGITFVEMKYSAYSPEGEVCQKSKKKTIRLGSASCINII